MLHLQTLTLLILLLCHAANGLAATQPSVYGRWIGLPSDSLVRMGAGFINQGEKYDSALICYTIVAEKYSEKLSRKEQQLAVRAFEGRWHVYFFHYFDYSQALENLQRAHDIARQTGSARSRISLDFGCMYQAMAEQSGDLKTDSLALSYYREAFRLAVAEKDHETMDMTISNLLTVAHTLGCLKTVGSEMDAYRRLRQQTGGEQLRYTMLHYEGLLLMEQGQWQQALQRFQSQLQLLGDGTEQVRYRCAACLNQARCHAALGDYAEAMRLLEETLLTARQHDMKDAKLEVFGLMEQYAAMAGNPVQADRCRHERLLLKDTLLNYQQVASIEELRFLGEIKDLDEKIRQERLMHERMRLLSLIFMGAAVLVGLFLAVLWRKNKRLREANTSLYRKNVALLQAEEEEHRQRKALEEMLRQEDNREKYSKSHLRDESKEQLMQKITDVVENSPEIFSADFTGQTLAAMIGSNYNYVSQVINECRGCNFSTYINEYRVREACRRLKDFQHYGHLTIEAVGNGVGFRSRTTFTTAFRRSTGLMPSEYRRIARLETEESALSRSNS